MSRSSFSRAASQRWRACAWHLGQCRFRHVMGRSPLRVLWGVIPYGELNAVTGAKATTRSPFFSPLRTWDCDRRAVPVGRIYPDRMPQMIRSRLVVKVAMRPSLRDRHAGDVPAVFEITTGMDTDHRIAICTSQPQQGRLVMGSRQPTTTA